MRVDLRSDTVTRPSAAMRRAMAEAEVGDDVYGEDPTVRRLEEAAAELTGQEAGLFVPSGTMGNQIALHLHGRPGDLVLCDADSHVIHYELSAMAVWSGLQPHPVATPDGRLDGDAVASAFRAPSTVQSGTRVAVLENTHNLAGGTVYRPEAIAGVVAVAREHGLRIHLDGARIFNAAVCCEVPVSRLTAPFDSVMFCLSKGLGAPVGSLLCGPAEWIAEARVVRKRFGGGLRQVGVLAAAGLVALDEGPPRLAVDHRHARRLAEVLADLPGVDVDPGRVETNIVVCRLRGGEARAERLLAELRDDGVLAGLLVGGRLRFVTHRDVDVDGIDHAIGALKRRLT